MNNNQRNYKGLYLDPDILTKARDGDAIAQVTLGKAYFNAVRFENNSLYAFEWFSRSAEQGNIEAQFLLANLYALGQGTKQSHVDAYKWYTNAALQGYKKALIRVYNLYQQEKKIHCRGKLNSKEGLRIKNYFIYNVQYYHRELNEQRLEDYKLILSNIIIYYTNQFQKYKSYNNDDPDNQLNLAFLYQYGYGVKKNIILAIEFYEKAAKKGHRDAQYHLGVLYQQNANIKFNYRIALRWYRASATNGNIAAQNNLAYFYEKGLSIELNNEGALYWYTKAANAGNSNAQLNLGKFHRKGQGVEQSFLEAARWYQLAAIQGNNAARNCLNQIFQTVNIKNYSDIEAISECKDELSSKMTLHSKLQKDMDSLHYSPQLKYLKKLAQHVIMADGNAMYVVGLKYFHGEYFPQDKDTGFQWIKKAAKAGNQEAEMKIAKMYEDGDTIEQDYHESSIWTVKLVKKKDDKAQNNLGILYKNGLGVRKDPLEASKWFIKSIDQGNRDALYQFGLLKFNGEGVRKDRNEAFKYFDRSARFKKMDAIFRLGYMYENGDSVEKDKFYAVKMYQAAAKQGYKYAQFRLGRIYEEGSLLQKDLVKALEYYTMAANSGDPSYQNELAIKYLNGVFDDPNYTMAYDLLKQAAEKENLIEGIIFKKPIIHFSKIDDISKIINMLTSATERGVEYIDYDIGYAYEFGINYGHSEVTYKPHTNNIAWYYSSENYTSTMRVELEKRDLNNYIKALEWYGAGNEKLLYGDYGGSLCSYNIQREKVFYSDYANSIKWYSAAVSRGDYRAHYRLGVIYEDGKGVSKDLKMAFGYYSQAYKNGNSNAAYRLAFMYLNGNGVSQDLIKAFHLFSEASYMGHTDASEMLIPSRISGNLEMMEAIAAFGYIAIQYQIGLFYEREDDLKSFKWFSLATQGGVTDAYYKLGLFYEEGRGTHINFLKATELYEKASRKDHKDALYKLARLYHCGQVIECDYLKAYNFYMRAAKLGHEDAQKVLNITRGSIIHSYEKNQEDAFDISSNEINDSLSALKSVAENGNIDLQYFLGVFYDSDGDSQDYEEALMWYKMAADNDHLEAIYHLGLLYEKGLGVKQDYSKSFELYNRAKIQENRCSLYRLGIAFQHGYGVNKSIEDALSCYTKAAELGNHESQYTLGVLYKEGSLVQKNIIRALVWFTKAYQNGNHNARDCLYDLYIDQPYEDYFYETLFQTLLKFKKVYKSDNIDFRDTYGIIHFKLGKLYFDGLGTTTNYEAALEQFLKAFYDYNCEDAKQFIPLEYNDCNSALQNNFLEMLQAYCAIKDELDGRQLYKLGVLYHDGAEIYFIDQNTLNISVPVAIVQKNELLAFQYIRLASERGHSEAQDCLGQIYLEEDGTNQDYNKAMYWFNIAAESMKPYQCYERGMRYFKDIKTERDVGIPLIYLRKAAERDHDLAQRQLAIMYLEGNGVKQNYDEAVKWFNMNAESIEPLNCYIQWMVYYKNTTIKRYFDISLIYLKKAAEGNFGPAQVLLSVVSSQGSRVESSLESRIKESQQSVEVAKSNYYNLKSGIKSDTIYDVHPPESTKFNQTFAQAQFNIMHIKGDGLDINYDKALQWIEKSTEQVHPYMCYDVGMNFYNGTKVDRNYDISLIYLRKADEKNVGKAQAQLGIMYFQGYGVEKNHDEAMRYIERSVLEMNAEECYNQGIKFYKGFKVDKNYELSLKYLRKAAIKKFGIAKVQIGLMYLQGNGVEKNRVEAMAWIKQSTKEMGSHHCYKQGIKFYTGIEVDKDYEISLIYLRKAAEEDYGLAQTQLGLMYLQGDGVKKNHNKAMKWIEQSINNMGSEEFYHEGMRFYRGIEVDRNYEISLLYLKKAAKEGKPHSQAQLAHMYSKGIAVEEDHEQATKWRNRIKYGYPKNDNFSLGQIYHYDEDGIQDFSKALEYYQKELHINEKGSTLRGVGLLYEYGDGVSQDYKKAMEYYKKVDDLYKIGAYYRLGLLFYYGRGVDQDYTNALNWFIKFVEQEPNDYEYHVSVRDDSGFLFFDEHLDHRYSLRPESDIYGVVHYYLGLMHKDGHGTAQSNDQAQVYFRKSLGYGIKRASNFNVQ